MSDFFFDLIAAVREEYGIYIRSHPKYVNKNERKKAWQRIAAKLNKTEDECEKRWKLLREKFSRILHKEIAPSGSGSCEETSWPYFEEMSFLRDHCKKRKKLDRKFDTSEVIFPDESESNDPLEAPTKKIKVDHHEEVVIGLRNALSALTNKIESQSSDDDDLFSKNITAMLKPFPMAQKDLIKAKIFNLITEERVKLYN